MNDSDLPLNAGRLRHAGRPAPLHAASPADVLADNLRERILRAEYPDGAALPHPRVLAKQANASRSAVRTALRILEVQGLVTLRTGRAGGAYVHTPGWQSVAYSVNLVLRGGKIRTSTLCETREAVEPRCAELAARRRSDEDLTRLEAANVGMSHDDSRSPEYLQANMDWHTAVATAARNELLSNLMSALFQAVDAAAANSAILDLEVRRAAVAAHRSITDAIQAQDPEAAARRMKRHVRACCWCPESLIRVR